MQIQHPVLAFLLCSGSLRLWVMDGWGELGAWHLGATGRKVNPPRCPDGEAYFIAVVIVGGDGGDGGEGSESS